MKRKIAIYTLALALSLSACGSKSGGETISANAKSVSEEIAEVKAEVKEEEVVPDEAKQYSNITFDIPEGFEPDELNTDYESYYLSGEINNLSYISYTKNVKPTVYTTVSQGEYEEAFLKKYSIEPIINEYEILEKEDYVRTRIKMEYTFGRTTYDATEYIFVTDSYIFSVCYCVDKSSDSAKAFEESAKTITLNSVIQSVNDDEMEGVTVSGNGILTEEEVMGKISAGVKFE